jgi:pimeloyl-ACP methyl ester carboxylesterase
LETLTLKYVNKESKFIEIEGPKHHCRLHYRDEGSGPVLFLLHGVCASLHTWDAWVDELKPFYRVIRFDIPGFGFSSPLAKGHYNPEIAVEIMEEFVSKMGIKDFFLAGNSIGGFIAWKYSLKYPDRVNKLILIDSVGYNQDLPWVVSLASNPFIRPIARRFMPRFFFEMAAKQVFGDQSKLTDQIRDRYFDLSTSDNNRNAYVDFFTVMRKLCHSEELCKGINEITAPLLVMWGTKDRWVPLKYFHLWKQNFPKGTFKTYEGVGHTPMEEIPVQTASDAHAFLMATG